MTHTELIVRLAETVTVIDNLTKALANAESALVSIGIERDHFRATVKELVGSSHYDGGCQERGLKDMTGMTT